MPSLPTPQAARLKLPSWRDTRLVVGVLLIAIGILVGSRAVASAQESTEVLAAGHVLVPGQAVKREDLKVVKVRLEDSGRYLPADAEVQPGAVALRMVGEGELVPRAGLGPADRVALRAVAVPADASQRRWLHAGDTVDLWVTPKEGAARVPQLLIASSTVASVPSDDSGGLGPRGGEAGVQVLVPVPKVGLVVGAVDRQDSITLVPVRRAS